jgi:Protein of unknown function (DUF1566)
MTATRKNICNFALILLLFIPSVGAGDDGHLGIQWSSDPVFIGKKRLHAETVVEKKSTVVQTVAMTGKMDRFIDNQDGTVTDTGTNLMWIKNGWRKEFFSASTWFEALDKCAKFNHGNYNDWRLPTIDEWLSLINTNFQKPALIEPNPFLNLISHIPYWTRSEYIYGRRYTCTRECPLETYVIMLYFGNVLHQKKTDKALILPVRTASYNHTGSLSY